MTARRKTPPPVAGGDESLGARVVALRTSGQSFPAIAKAIEVGNVEAFALFVDEVGKRPPDEQAELRAVEGKRLDALERRANLNEDTAVRDRRLASIKTLRRRLAGS